MYFTRMICRFQSEAAREGWLHKRELSHFGGKITEMSSRFRRGGKNEDPKCVDWAELRFGTGPLPAKHGA